jgi:hypothetical protein
MAEHTIQVELPEKLILSKDVRFIITSNRQRLGTLHVSQGSIDWLPASGQKWIRVGWEQFADLMLLKKGINMRTNGIKPNMLVARFNSSVERACNLLSKGLRS